MEILARRDITVTPFSGGAPIDDSFQLCGELSQDDVFRIKDMFVEKRLSEPPNLGIMTGPRADLDVVMVEAPADSDVQAAFRRELLRNGGIFMMVDGKVQMVYRHATGPDLGTYTVGGVPLRLVNYNTFSTGPGSLTDGGEVTIHGPGIHDDAGLEENILALARRTMMPNRMLAEFLLSTVEGSCRRTRSRSYR